MNCLLNRCDRSILGLLLESELVGVATLALAAVAGLEGQGGVALTADLFVTVELFGNSCNGRVHHTSPQAQHQVQS